jgi:hypothetical protein
MHDYIPDFIIRLKTDPAVHLILETKRPCYGKANGLPAWTRANDRVVDVHSNCHGVLKRSFTCPKFVDRFRTALNCIVCRSAVNRLKDLELKPSPLMRPRSGSSELRPCHPANAF